MLSKSLVLALSIVLELVGLPRTEPGAAISVVRVPNGGIQPQAVMGPGGILHLLYFSGDPKNGDLYYVNSRDDGVTWSTPLRVNSTPGSAIALGTIRGGQMAIGRNGSIHVAWNGSDAVESSGPVNPESGQRGAPMLYSRLRHGHRVFDAERNLMKRSYGLDGGGSIAADSAGDVYVGWHGKVAGAAEGEAGRQVWIAASHDDGATFGVERPAWAEPTGACGCCGMALFADSRGTVRALYRSATDNIHRDIFLLTSNDRGQTFTGRKLHAWDINACPMTSMGFSEGAGTVFGAWETGGQVYFENLTKPGALPVSAPGVGKGRKHPRIAISSNGHVAMVWTEGTGWQRGGRLAWQLFDLQGKSLGETHTEAGIPAWSFATVAASADRFIILY